MFPHVHYADADGQYGEAFLIIEFLVHVTSPALCSAWWFICLEILVTSVIVIEVVVNLIAFRKVSFMFDGSCHDVSACFPHMLSPT